ncbi:MAG: 3'-5' exonuclease [Slackia sp.]|nr:3'-5' exonuclease [Slackia sp.]
MNPIYEQNIVMDLEFTKPTDEAVRSALRFEIIQIGAVRVDAYGNALDTFDSYVRPRYASDIAWKVKQLTGISRSDVCDADCLEDVMGRFLDWVGDSPTRIVTWSRNDFKQLSSETRFKGLPFSLGDMRWLDLQKIYPRLMGVGRKGRDMALKTAAEWYGVEVADDLLHGALYDATVTAELLRRIMTGDYLKQKNVFSEVMCAPSEHEVLSANVGGRFAGLLDLKASLLAEACG